MPVLLFRHTAACAVLRGVCMAVYGCVARVLHQEARRQKRQEDEARQASEAQGKAGDDGRGGGDNGGSAGTPPRGNPHHERDWDAVFDDMMNALSEIGHEHGAQQRESPPVRRPDVAVGRHDQPRRPRSAGPTAEGAAVGKVSCWVGCRRIGRALTCRVAAEQNKKKKKDRKPKKRHAPLSVQPKSTAMTVEDRRRADQVSSPHDRCVLRTPPLSRLMPAPTVCTPQQKAAAARVAKVRASRERAAAKVEALRAERQAAGAAALEARRKARAERAQANERAKQVMLDRRRFRRGGQNSHASAGQLPQPQSYVAVLV